MNKSIKRKRKFSKTVPQFTVVASDFEGEGTIRQKAKNYKMRAFKKGRTQYWLYFQCSEKTWSKFSSEIKKHCSLEPPVKCPRRVRKSILNILHITAKCRFSPARERSLKILANLSVKHKAEKPQTEHQLNAATVPTLDNKPMDYVKSNVRSRILEYRSRVNKFIKRIFVLTKQSRYFRLAHGG